MQPFVKNLSVILLFAAIAVPALALGQNRPQPPTPINILVLRNSTSADPELDEGDVVQSDRERYRAFTAACSPTGNDINARLTGSGYVSCPGQAEGASPNCAPYTLYCGPVTAPPAQPQQPGGGATPAPATAPPTAQTVAASDSFTPLTNLPGITTTANSDTLPALFNNLYKLCIGAAAVIAILQIMRAGTYFFFNKGSVAHNEKAKGLISNSVLGLLLVLSPAIVFGIINPDILKLNLDISRLKTSFTPPAPTRPDLRNETFSQERQNQLFCEEFRKPGHRVQAVPFQGTNRNECQRIEGSNKGWMSIPTGCCSNVPSQGICCGYDPDQDGRLLNPPTGGGTGEFFINYVFSDRESQDDNPNTRCKAQDRQQYETLEACTQALYPPAAVIACVSGTNGSSVPCYSSKVHNCNAAKTSVYLPDRAAFDRINALTTCLYE